MPNKIVQDLEKAGEKIIAVVDWPVKHAEMICEFMADAKKDYPATEAAIVKTVELIEQLGPDAVTAIAAKGLDIPEDGKVEGDVQALFAYIKDTLLPAIEADYADFRKLKTEAAAPAPPAAGAPDPAAGAGPQVHTQTPA
jgi:hypothetical protein